MPPLGELGVQVGDAPVHTATQALKQKLDQTHFVIFVESCDIFGKIRTEPEATHFAARVMPAYTAFSLFVKNVKIVGFPAPFRFFSSSSEEEAPIFFRAFRFFYLGK